MEEVMTNESEIQKVKSTLENLFQVHDARFNYDDNCYKVTGSEDSLKAIEHELDELGYHDDSSGFKSLFGIETRTYNLFMIYCDENEPQNKGYLNL